MSKPYISRSAVFPHRPSKAPHNSIIEISSDEDEEVFFLQPGRLPLATHHPLISTGPLIPKQPSLNRHHSVKRAKIHPHYIKTETFPSSDDNPTTLALRTPAQFKDEQPETVRIPRPVSQKPVDTEIAPSRPQRKRVRTPYYYDVSLECTMYRGPGYDRFPVVLGTVAGHQEICDKWDRKMQARNQRRRSLPQPPVEDIKVIFDVTSLLESDCITDESEESEMSDEDTELFATILEVLPGIQHSFLRNKIRSCQKEQQNNDEWEDQEQINPTEVIAGILEAGDYPQEARNVESSHDLAGDDGTGVTIVWDKDLFKDEQYFREAVRLLATEFLYIPTCHISKTVRELRSLFHTYVALHDAEEKFFETEPRPYRRHRKPRQALEKRYAATEAEERNNGVYHTIVNEFQAAKQKVVRDEEQRAKQEREQEEEATNLEIHRAQDLLIECQCCFDEDIPINRAVTCENEDAHFFCYDCVRGLADTQVGAMKYEMLCMDGSGCTAQLSPDAIGQALPIKIFNRLAFNQQQAEINAAFAGSNELEQCPRCDFKALCGSVSETPIFTCLNPDCRRATCRKCTEEAHVPKTCEETKKDRGLSARHQVEEARSDAMMRKCPKCKVRLIKEYGCNKMVCTCGAKLCYVCNADISGEKEGGYNHFNRHGAKCKLYDEPGVNRHEREADDAEREAIKKAREQNEDLDEKVLQIETGAAKKKQSGNQRAQQQLPQMPPGLPPHYEEMMNRYFARHGAPPAGIPPRRAPSPPHHPPGLQLVGHELPNMREHLDIMMQHDRIQRNQNLQFRGAINNFQRAVERINEVQAPPQAKAQARAKAAENRHRQMLAAMHLEHEQEMQWIEREQQIDDEIREAHNFPFEYGHPVPVPLAPVMGQPEPGFGARAATRDGGGFMDMLFGPFRGGPPF